MAPAGAAERLAEAIRIPTISHEGIHGTDERISVADYDAAIRFYRQLLLNTSGPPAQ